MRIDISLPLLVSALADPSPLVELFGAAQVPSSPPIIVDASDPSRVETASTNVTLPIVGNSKQVEANAPVQSSERNTVKLPQAQPAKHQAPNVPDNSHTADAKPAPIKQTVGDVNAAPPLTARIVSNSTPTPAAPSLKQSNPPAVPTVGGAQISTPQSVHTVPPATPPPVQAVPPSAPPPVQAVSPSAPPPVQAVSPSAPPPVQAVQPSTPPPVQAVPPSAPPPVQAVQPSTPPAVQAVSPSAPPPVQAVSPSAPPPVQAVQPSTPPAVQAVSPSAAPLVQAVPPSAPPPEKSVQPPASPAIKAVPAAAAHPVQAAHKSVKNVESAVDPSAAPKPDSRTDRETIAETRPKHVPAPDISPDAQAAHPKGRAVKSPRAEATGKDEETYEEETYKDRTNEDETYGDETYRDLAYEEYTTASSYREFNCEAAPWISPWAAAFSKWNDKLEPYYKPVLTERGDQLSRGGVLSRIRGRVLWATSHPSVSGWLMNAPERVSGFITGLADELEGKALHDALFDLYLAVYGEKNWGFVCFLASLWLGIVLIRRSLDIRHARAAWARQVTATEKLLEFQNHNLETLRGDIKLLMKYNEKSIRDLELWKEQQEIDQEAEPDDFLHDKRDVRIGRYAGRLIATLMDYQMDHLQGILQTQFPGIQLPPAPRLRQVVENMPGPQLLEMPDNLLVVTQPAEPQYLQNQNFPPPTIFDPYAQGHPSPSKPTQPSESEIVGGASPAVETLMECVDVGLSEVEDALRTLTLKIDLLSHWSAENALRLGVIDQVILTVMRQLAEVISDVRTTTKATQLKSVLDPVWEKMSNIFDDPRTAAGVTDYLITLQEERYDYIGRLRAVGEVFARLDDPSTHQTLFHWTESLFKLRVEAPPGEAENSEEIGNQTF